jgi:hypothetical protein
MLMPPFRSGYRVDLVNIDVKTANPFNQPEPNHRKTGGELEKTFVFHVGNLRHKEPWVKWVGPFYCRGFTTG